MTFLIIIGAILVYCLFWYLHAQDQKTDMILDKEFTHQENIIINKYEPTGDMKIINNVK